MIYLITASLIWCFSFGLIGRYLTALPSAWLAASRLILAFLVFLPFIKRIKSGIAIRLFATGAIQFGLMYLAYMHSYKFLKSHEVVLFTIFTPIYISLINDIQTKKVNPLNLIAALTAVAGAGVILWEKENFIGSMTGFCFVQVANILFAAGQMFYRTIFNNNKETMKDYSDRDLMSWLYLGGFIILLPMALHDMIVQMPKPGWRETSVIIYLGVVASGLAFFLWNTGVRKVSAGTLAVMNNLKIPTGVLVSLIVFGEEADVTALLCGSALIGAAIWAMARKSKLERPTSNIELRTSNKE